LSRSFWRIPVGLSAQSVGGVASVVLWVKPLTSASLLSSDTITSQSAPNPQIFSACVISSQVLTFCLLVVQTVKTTNDFKSA
jgi:hypothetical protein